MIPSHHQGVVGFTKSERYLALLCERTFLSLWSHPNLFRASNKELADLLVVFGEDIIIFSDKSCEYKEGEYGWQRWYKRAILDSAHQLYRAAGWIRSHPSEIYMDVRCQRRFPLHLPTSPRIHLIAVATGAREAAAKQLGGNGSLEIVSDSDGSQPFCIGDLDRSKDFVHVFDDTSLTAVMNELDTVSDLVAYLGKKADFFRASRVVMAEQELDLLAHYLLSLDDTDQHDFVIPLGHQDATALMFGGHWDTFARSGPYLRKKEAEKPSYLWDRIITNIAAHTDQGTLAFGQEQGLAGIEPALRALASENRFSRRLLARSLIDVRQASATGTENFRVRTVLSRERGERAYLLIAVRRSNENEEQFRKFRQSMMQAHILITKYRRDTLCEIIGIAVGPANDPDDSVDFAMRVFDDWTAEDREKALQLCDALGWSRDTAHLETHRHFDEYPAPDPEPGGGQQTRSHAKPTKIAAKKMRKAQRAARKAHKR